MAKDPAFLFYYDRFLAGTISMTDEEVGQYIRLMCIQANKGYVTKKDMLKICGTHDSDVYLKFDDIGGEKFANRILSETLEQRRAYSDSRRKNRKGKNQNQQTDMNTICSSCDEHMVNVNVNKDVNVIRKEVQEETKPENVPRDTGDDIAPLTDDWFNRILDERTTEELAMSFKGIDITDQWSKFIAKVRGSPDDYRFRDIGGMRLAFNYHLRQAKPQKNGTTKSNIGPAAVITKPSGFGNI